MKRTLSCLAVFTLLLIFNARVSPVFAQGSTAFTYQGQLHDNGTNANGAYTMIFALYDSPSGSNLIGGPTTNGVTFANGLFTVNLDFGAGVFNGAARWLDITVQYGTNLVTGGPLVSQELSPRVQVLPAPYAQFAAVAATVTNHSIMNSQLASYAVASTNLQTNAVATFNIQSNAITAALLASNSVSSLAIQTGAITDSKLAATTSLLSTYGIETNLRVVRGVLSGAGTNIVGSGYTVTNYPPGTGGTVLGYYYVSDDGIGDYMFTLVDGSILTGGVSQYDWIAVNGGGGPSDAEILQVQSAYYNSNNSYTITTYGNGCGRLSNNPYNQVSVNPRLADEFDITFTPPFSSYPAITVASHGVTAFSSGSAPWVDVTRSGTNGGTNFTVNVGYLNQNGVFGGGCAPWGDGFEFIAIGPK